MAGLQSSNALQYHSAMPVFYASSHSKQAFSVPLNQRCRPGTLLLFNEDFVAGPTQSNLFVRPFANHFKRRHLFQAYFFLLQVWRSSLT